LFGQGFTIHTPFKDGSSPYFDFLIKHFSKASLAWKRLGNTRAVRLKKIIIMFVTHYKIIIFP